MENNGEVVVSNSKMVPEELIALGFPSITENTFNWWGPSWDEIMRDFYNSIYTLKKLYEKYTSKKLKLSVSFLSFDRYNYTIFLSGKMVFSCSLPNRSHNYQNLQRLKNLVQELIPLVGSFENLKQEFTELYKKEKAKSDLNEIELYRWNSPKFKETEAEQERDKLIEALKNDKELAKKEVFHIKKSLFFGKRHSIKKSKLKLKKALDDVRIQPLLSMRIYKNFLLIETPVRDYAVKLTKAERQKILNILTLLKL